MLTAGDSTMLQSNSSDMRASINYTFSLFCHLVVKDKTFHCMWNEAYISIFTVYGNDKSYCINRGTPSGYKWKCTVFMLSWL